MKFNPLRRIAKCKQRISTIERSFRETLYSESAHIYHVASTFCGNRDDEYERFRDLDFWHQGQKRPSVDDDHRTKFLFACRYAFSARKASGSRYNRAYKVARALYDLFEAEVEYTEVAAELKKRGGAHYFYAPDRADSSEVKFSSPDETDELDETTSVMPLRHRSGDSVSELDDDDLDDSEHDDDTKSQKKKPRGNRVSRSDLVLEMDDLAAVLALEPGQIANLEIQVLEFDGDWLRIKGRLLD